MGTIVGVEDGVGSRPSRVPTQPNARRPATRPTAGSGARSGRRPRRIVGLDGLRALAVVAVIVYHVAPDVLPGGFLGVDVFFVVSGFIITTLLLRQLRETRRIRLTEFWARRARRLLPALGVVVVTSVLAARIVQPDLLVGIGRQVLGAATFSSNWLEIAAGGSYFAATQPVLFQTFWSLAVEEQFYVVWPVVLVLLIVLVRSAAVRAWIAVAGALASAVLMAVLYDPAGDPTRVYFGTDTHMFGLLMGVAAAFWWATGARLLGRRLSRWAVPAAFGGMVVLMLTLHAESAWAYRGGIFLGSLLALVLVARCADATGAARTTAGVRVLQARPVVWVGERSYGLYLWHWPLLLIVGAAVGAQEGTPEWWRGTALAVLLTLLLAAASYRWVEVPVRRRGFRGTARRVRDSLDRLAPHAVRARALASFACVAVLAATVVVTTAPRTSQAQLAVEQGAATVAAAEKAQARTDAEAEKDGADKAGDVSTDTVKDAGDKGKEPAAKAGGAANTDEEPSKADAGAPPKTSAGEAPAVSGKDMTAIGDSVLSGAAPAMLETFPGIHLDGVPIRKWLDAPGLVEKAEKAGDLRDVVVLQFGTNGGFQFTGSEDALDDVLDIIGPDRTVVLVTAVGVSSWVPDANKTLEKVAKAHDNVVVAEWDDAVRKQPGLLHADRTHPNMDGIAVYAKTIKKAIASRS